jgi:hypothetical protein
MKTAKNKRYSYPRVAVIRIDVHPAGEPDQHATHIPCLVHIWFQTIRISHSQHIATFHIVVNRFEQILCPREEGLSTQPTARRLISSRVRTQLLSHNIQWGSEKKTSFCWQLATKLTEPISPTCDRYVQYLLTGANPSVLNRHRRGYNLGGAGFPYTTPRPSQPAVSTFHIRAPSGLQLKHIPPIKPKLRLRNIWPPCGLPTTWPSTETYIYA